MKILELTNYSAGICGVWQRVKQESIELSKKGHEVRIFTSNLTKGSDLIAPSEEKLDKIKIKRFPSRKIGGEAFMKWDFESSALEYSPDIIIAHSYRHPHTLKALKIAEKLKKQGKSCKVFLVTHAPFILDNSTRSFLESIAVYFYDTFYSRFYINNYNNVINITKWEIPFLFNIGVKKEKLAYIPNGIPEEFFKSKIKTGNNLLFLGRISPVKDIETLMDSVKNLNVKLDIVGPGEGDYLKKLKNKIENECIKNIRFLPPVYDLNEKINLIDSHEIIILPSKTEAMPQSLIEAMARGKITISSDTRGGKEIIADNKNGFLFKIGNSVQLREILEKIKKLTDKEKSVISKNAQISSRNFEWKNLINELEALF